MLIQRANPVCYKSNPLPHNLSGIVTIGTIGGSESVNVLITCPSLGASKKYAATSDVLGLLQITIPESDSDWYTAFEKFGYKIHVLQDGCTIPFEVSGDSIECVNMMLEIDCDSEAPYELEICVEESNTNCITC